MTDGEPTGADPMDDNMLRADHAPHSRALGIKTHDAGRDRTLLSVEWREDLVGEPDSGIIAGGVITALLDHACGHAVQVALSGDGDLQRTPIATLDLRIDYMRPAEPRKEIFASAHCYRITRSIAFVRAVAYDREESDPVATVQASFIRTGKTTPNV